MKNYVFIISCFIMFRCDEIFGSTSKSLTEVPKFEIKEKYICPRESLKSNSKCNCKDYGKVEGCKECWTENLKRDASSSDCLSCYCSGVSDDCESSDWIRDAIWLSFTNGTEGLELVFRNRTKVSTKLEFDPGKNEVFADNLESTNLTYYWSLPELFKGDKLTSYGGQIRFVSDYEIHNKIMDEKWLKSPLVIMKGNGIKLYSRFRKTQWLKKSHVVELSEIHWYKRRKKLQSTHKSHHQVKDTRKRKLRRRKPVKRSEMMKLLSNIEFILIKANSQTNIKRVSLSSPAMSSAVPESNEMFQSEATSVESCRCPAGYGGLSCQYCLSGYTEGKRRSRWRRQSLQCVPCKCNGHSDSCHPKTGECSDCLHNTAGKHCQYSLLQCNSGGTYELDNKKGSEARCKCKARVQGELCSSCKSGYFNLAQTNYRGCTKCWCNGVTFQCKSSKLRRFQLTIQPPSYIYVGISSGNSALDLRPVKMNDGRGVFEFRNFDSSRRYHWSLPKPFTGNILRSYGGELQFSVLSKGHCLTPIQLDSFVELESFEGIVVKWTYSPKVSMGKSLKFRIKLVEDHFTFYNMKTDRGTFLKILQSLKHIRVHIPNCYGLRSTEIDNMVLDTAVSWATKGPVAMEVEECFCPPGYSGLSCENCSPGYVRKPNGRRCVRKGF